MAIQQLPGRFDVSDPAARTRLPTARNVPSVAPARDPGLRVPAPVPLGLGDLGGAVAGIGERMVEADNRIKTRQEALDRMRLKGRLNEDLRGSLEAFDTTGDLSDPQVLESWRKGARESMAKLRTEYQGREEGGLVLDEEFESIFNQHADRAGIRSVQAGDARVEAQAGDVINELSARARKGENPDDLIDEGMEHMKPGSDLRDALRAGGDIAFTRKLQESVTIGSLDRLFSAGQIDLVENAMDNPAIQRVLGQEAQNGVFRRIEQARAEQVRMATQPIKGIPRDVFAALPPQAQMRVLELDADEPKVKDIPQSVYNSLTPEQQLDFLGVGEQGEVKGVPRDVWNELEPEQQQRILGADPEEVMVKGVPLSVFQRMTPEQQTRMLGAEPETKVLGAGDVLVRGGTPEDPNAIVEVARSPFKPGSFVSIVNKGEEALAKGIGEADSKRVIEIDERADVADRTLGEVTRMEAAMESGQFTTGSLSDVRTILSRFAVFVGASDDIIDILGNPATADTIDAAVNRLAVEEASNLGRITNMSLGFVRDALPSLTRTEGGNRILLEVMRESAEREIEIANLTDQYLDRHGGKTRPGDASSLWQTIRDFKEENPIITPELEKRILEGAKDKAPTLVDRFDATAESAIEAVQSALPEGSSVIVRSQEELDQMRAAGTITSGTQFTWQPEGQPPQQFTAD